MSIGGVTGLPFQKDLLVTQQIGTEQKSKLGVFQSKQEESKTLAQKLQTIAQTYQQKGSIFQTENYKTNVVEDGYMGKLVDQKWAESNHTYEQTNVKRLNLSSQSLENAVIQTNINLKEHEARITKTSNENTDLEKTINANSQQIETMAKIFSTEEQSKAAENYAKGSFDYYVNKDNALNNELSSLESTKNNSSKNIENKKQKIADSNNSINSLTARKGNIAQTKSTLSSKKSSIAFDIDSIKNNIGNLKAQKGASKAQKTVQTGKGAVEETPNTSIAIDTAETVQENNGTAAVIAETKKVNTTETGTSEQVVQEESNQSSVDSEIDAQILGLEASLAAKIDEQAKIDEDIEAQTNEEKEIDLELKAKNADIEQLSAEQTKEEKNVSDIDNKISSKEKEISDNKVVTKEKEEIYKKASETHSADLAKSNEIEAQYKELVTATNTMKEKRNSNDQGLKKLNGLKNYLNTLLEGQGNAKAGVKANLEIAEKKEAKEYETLKIKNKMVETGKIGLFSQKDSEFKAKGDFNSVQLEMESYNNIFSTVAKA